MLAVSQVFVMSTLSVTFRMCSTNDRSQQSSSEVTVSDKKANNKCRKIIPVTVTTVLVLSVLILIRKPHVKKHVQLYFGLWSHN